MSQQGQVIFNGRYELHRRLGRGGMAEVYLARDQLLDRPVAVKVLFPALATDPGFVERFRREAQSAANLSHPNVVNVFDWGEANGTYFIVMEYVEGITLAEVIRDEGRLHPDRAAEIASDIGAALGFAHRSGVVHRDVKPGNVLITRDGMVKVADFGIARAVSDSSDASLTKTGSVMGTATYFSPEQARGSQVDPRSDIYSLGCVLYEMVTGRPPFSGENAVAIAYKHVQENVVPPRRIDPALPETLEAITLKCLAKNPANRYPSAADLRADLRRYLDGARILAEPVLAPPVDPGATGLMAPTQYDDRTALGGAPTAWQDQRYDRYDDYEDYDRYPEEEEKPKRNRWLIAGLVLLLLGVAGLLFFLAQDDDEPPDVATVRVPTVIGQPADQAQATLEEAGLEVERREGPSADQPEGRVFRQDPEAGEEVDERSIVTIFVSTGPETQPVPNVVGLQQQEAVDALTAAGFVPNPQPDEDSDEEEGTVVRQDPAANTQLAAGETVTIFVATGPNAVEIPDVSGQPEGQARSTLEGLGFQVNSQQEASNDVEAGRVIRTEPGPGQAPQGSTVTLFVSSGPGQVGVPNVEGLTEDNARSLLEDAGLEMNVAGEQNTNNPDLDGIVARQSPGTGQQVDIGSTVNVVIFRLNGGGG